jgi:serine/threonine-protein kinase
VVEELKLTLPSAATSSAARTENAAAHNLYLLGRKYEDQPTPESQKSAIESFNGAIALDPGYAAAYARLALCEASLADLTGDPNGLDRASAAAERAITLAPDSADGYQARAQVRSTFLWDWDGANADFAKALAIDPNNSDALYGFSTLLATQGRLPEALAAIDKAIGIDPLVARYYNLRARLLNYTGDTAAARAAYHQLLSISPEHPHANVDLALLDLRAGRAEQALADLQQPAAPGWRLYGSALVEHSLGHVQQAQQALDQFIATTAQFAAFQVGEIYAWRGQKDLAFQWLERAYTQHDGGLTEIKNDPLLASLHADPRYQAFMRKMNLAP